MLTFDFNNLSAPSPFLFYTVRGTHVDETVDATLTGIVEVEFKHHGLHTLDVIADYEDTSDERGDESAVTKTRWLCALKSELNGENRVRTNPCR